jgi:septal ring factor EnvC (AmiA/AmiB activator)
MDIYELTINQLKRATAIKEQIEKLNKELGSILGGAIKSGAASTKKRTMSASTKKKIAAVQRARWRAFVEINQRRVLADLLPRPGRTHLNFGNLAACAWCKVRRSAQVYPARC